MKRYNLQVSILLMSKDPKLPFKALGQRLKSMRHRLQETMDEVSGAVEIDAATLERIEQGRERPSEDILDLLITHFGIPADEAENLWRLAGYELPEDQPNTAKIMIMAIDPRVIYSDHLQANADQNGVVLNFVQKVGGPMPITAARIGMSRQQAAKVAQVIQEVLAASEPRKLPRQPDHDSPNSNKKQRDSS